MNLKKATTALLTAVLITGMTSITASAEVTEGDITDTGIIFEESGSPKEEKVYTAGEGTLTWTPNVVEDEIESVVITLENASINYNEAGAGLNYKLGGKDLTLRLVGENKITTTKQNGHAVSTGGSSAVDVEIVGVDGGSLTIENTYAYESDSFHTGLNGKNITFTDAEVNIINDTIIAVPGADINVNNSTLAIDCRTNICNMFCKNINIDNSTLKLLLESENKAAIRAPGSISITNSDLEIYTKGEGISGWAEDCEINIEDSTVYCEGNKAITSKNTTNTCTIENSTVTAVGNEEGLKTPFTFTSGGVWDEDASEIIVYGTVSASPEEENKTILLEDNAHLTITNDASCDVTFSGGSALMAKNAKNLTVQGENPEIRLNDEIGAIDISGSVTKQYEDNIILSHSGDAAPGAAVVTVSVAEDTAKFDFDDTSYFIEGNKILKNRVKLDPPTGLKWKEGSVATAVWDEVEHAVSYTINLYRNGEKAVDMEMLPEEREYDFLSEIEESGSYTFQVRANGADDTGYTTSDFSQDSPPKTFTVFPITVTSGVGGSAACSRTVGVEGEAITLTCTANSGYQFSRWVVEKGGITVSAGNTFSMPAEEVAVRAEFVKKETSSSSSGGKSGTPKSSITTKGDATSLKADGSLSKSMAEKAVDEAKKNNSDNITVDSSQNKVTLPAGMAENMGRNTAAGLVIDTPKGSVSIPNEALEDMEKGGEITIELGDSKAVISSGGRELTDIGKIQITVPYDKNERTGNVSVELTNPDGTKTVIENVYDGGDSVTFAAGGTVYFEILDNYVPLSAAPEDNKNPFQDIENHWAKEDILSVYESGLMSGVSATVFAPDMDTTRGMVAAVLYRMSGEEYPDEETVFPDVKPGAFYNRAAAWGHDRNVVTGYDDGLFRPDREITREELALLLYKYAVYKGMNVSDIEGMAIREFTDFEEISDWAETAVRYCLNAGLMRGRDDGSLGPRDKATRAELASILSRFGELRQ